MLKRREVASAAPGGRADRAPEPPPEEEGGETSSLSGARPPEGWLDYPRLELAGPTSANPGRLEPAQEPLAGSPPLRNALAQASARVREAEGKELPRHAAPVRASAGHFDDRYDAAAPITIEGDGRWHTFALFDADVALTPSLVCVPGKETRVYRWLSVKNRSPHALLAGPAEVSVAGTFLATVAFPTLAPGGEERLGLGVEEAVQVSRNVRFHEEAGGLLGGSTLLVHELELEAVNRLASKVSLTLFERVPQSQEKEVQVEELAVKPPWQKADGLPEPVEGARAWQLELGPSERKKLEAKFQIRIPAGRVLAGGNRRL